MIEGISSQVNNQIKGINSINSYRDNKDSLAKGTFSNFNLEDEAIISAQAQMLNELEKYNAGESNEIELAVSTVMAEHQVAANVNVINSKTEMMDSLLDMMD